MTIKLPPPSHLKRRLTISLSLALTFLTALVGGVSAGSINGRWLRVSSGGHILVYACGGGIGMKIVRSSKKDNVGRVIMCGAKARGGNKWKGRLFNVEDGKIYTGYVSLEKDGTLKLQGCVLAGLICRSDKWKRLR